jgi:serine/threonine protein kinase
MIAKGGIYKIGDYGLVKLQRFVTDLTKSGVFPGTPPYMPPETDTSNGLPKPDHRWDIYSTGIILSQLSTGEVKPFNELEPQRLTNVKPELQEVIKKATAWHPDSRYSSAQEFLDSINQIRASN